MVKKEDPGKTDAGIDLGPIMQEKYNQLYKKLKEVGLRIVKESGESGVTSGTERLVLEVRLGCMLAKGWLHLTRRVGRPNPSKSDCMHAFIHSLSTARHQRRQRRQQQTPTQKTKKKPCQQTPPGHEKARLRLITMVLSLSLTHILLCKVVYKVV